MKQRRWKPKDLEFYWTLSFGVRFGSVQATWDFIHATWDNDRIDKERYRTGNCFRTRKEAEQKLREIKQLLKH